MKSIISFDRQRMKSTEQEANLLHNSGRDGSYGLFSPKLRIEYECNKSVHSNIAQCNWRPA